MNTRTSNKRAQQPRVSWRNIARTFTVLAVLAVAAAALNVDSATRDAQAQTATFAIAGTTSCTFASIDVEVTARQPASLGFRYHELRAKRSTSSVWSNWVQLFQLRQLLAASSDDALWNIEAREVFRFGLIFSYGSTISVNARGARVGCPLNVESYPGNANGTIRTHWDAPSSGTVTGYQYRQKLTSASWPSTGNMGWTAVTAGNRFVEFSTSSNAQHDIQIRSVNQVGSPPSNVYSIIAQDQHDMCCYRSRQNRPTTFNAATGTDPGEVDLSWTGTTAPSNVLWRETSTTRWDLSDRAAGDHGRQGVPTGTSTTLTLIPNHSYEFAVQNTTASSGVSGFRTATARTGAVPPPTGLQLALNNANPGQIDATWTYPTPATTILDGFEYSQRRQGGGWTTWTDATAPATNPTVPGTTWTQAITGVGRVGETVEVRIRSQISLQPGGGSSTEYFSPPVSGMQQLQLPDAPTAVNATSGTNVGDLDVTWTAATATLPSGSTYAGVRARYRRTSDTTWPNPWQTVAQGTTTLTFATGVGNVEYEIEVQTQVDLDGTGPGAVLVYSASSTWTGIAMAIAGPTAPATGVAAATAINCEARLTWEAPSGVTVQRYRYRYAIVPTPPDAPSWSHWLQTADGSTLSAVLTGLNPTGNYQFEIQAVHATQGTSSSLSATLQLTQLSSTVPCAPRDFSALPSAVYGQLALTWEAPSIGTASKYQMRFKRSTDTYPATGAMGWADISPTLDGTTYSTPVQTTGEGITWDVEVRAVDTSGASDVNGSVASANPPVHPKHVPIPSWLQSLSGTAVGSVQLLWGDPSEEGFTPWRYQRRIKPATGNWGDTGSEWTLVPGGNSARTLQITGLTAATNYDIELRAVVLLSGSAQVYSLQLDHQAEAAALLPVANFRATPQQSPGSVQLTWDEPAGTVNFRALRVRTSSSEQWGEEIILTGASPQNITLGPGHSRLLGLTVVTSTGRTGFTSLSRAVQGPTVKTPRNVEVAASTDTYGAADMEFRVPTGSSQYDGFQYRAKRQDAEWDTSGDMGWQDTSAPALGRVTQAVVDPAGESGITLDIQVRTAISLQPIYETAASDFYSEAVPTTSLLTAVPEPTRVFARPGLLVGDLELTWRHATIPFTGYTRTGTRILWKPADENQWRTIDLVGPGADGQAARSYFFVFDRGWVPYDIVVKTIVESSGVTTYSPGVERSARTKANPGPIFPSFGPSAERTANPGEVILYWIAPEEEFDSYRIRHEEVTGGVDPQWQDNWISYSRTATSARISGLHLAKDPVTHRFQIQTYHFTLGGSVPLELDVEFPGLPTPHDFTVYMSQGTATLGWNEPPTGTAHGHRYRWRKTNDPDAPGFWSEWVVENVVDDDPDATERYSHEIHGLEAETSYTFELQSVYNQDSFSRSVFRRASTLVALPILSKIEPQSRTVAIPASANLRLAVDVYDQQGDVANSAVDNRTSIFAGYTFEYIWNDAGAGGTLETVGDGRIASYKAPSDPGTYRITVEIGPAGVCEGHHEVPPDFEECRAIITLSVTRPQQTDVTTAEPVNPTGLIPSDITDVSGNAYEVFTPADGGRFESGDGGLTVTAEPGVVPNGTLVGIRAESAPSTGRWSGFSSARITFAEGEIRLFAADVQGEPISDLRLADPLQLCAPLPVEMRSRLDVVTLVQLPALEDDDITVLQSRVYRIGDGLNICGAVSQLPATLAVARLGVTPTATPDQGPDIGDIDAGGQTLPGAGALLVLTVLALVAAGTAAIRRSRLCRMTNTGVVD